MAVGCQPRVRDRRRVGGQMGMRIFARAVPSPPGDARPLPSLASGQRGRDRFGFRRRSGSSTPRRGAPTAPAPSGGAAFGGAGTVCAPGAGRGCMNQNGVETQTYLFPADRLIAYQLAKEALADIARLSTTWPGYLRDQAQRASSSALLNIAEGVPAGAQRGQAAALRHRAGQHRRGRGHGRRGSRAGVLAGRCAGRRQAAVSPTGRADRRAGPQLPAGPAVGAAAPSDRWPLTCAATRAGTPSR